jgi:hypothetical protein
VHTSCKTGLEIKAQRTLTSRHQNAIKTNYWDTCWASSSVPNHGDASVNDWLLNAWNLHCIEFQSLYTFRTRHPASHYVPDIACSSGLAALSRTRHWDAKPAISEIIRTTDRRKLASQAKVAQSCAAETRNERRSRKSNEIPQGTGALHVSDGRAVFSSHFCRRKRWRKIVPRH